MGISSVKSPSIVPDFNDQVPEFVRLVETLISFDDLSDKWVIADRQHDLFRRFPDLFELVKQITWGRNQMIAQKARNEARNAIEDAKAVAWARQYRAYENKIEYYGMVASDKKALIGRRHPPKRFEHPTLGEIDLKPLRRTQAIEVIDRGLSLIQRVRYSQNTEGESR